VHRFWCTAISSNIKFDSSLLVFKMKLLHKYTLFRLLSIFTSEIVAKQVNNTRISSIFVEERRIEEVPKQCIDEINEILDRNDVKAKLNLIMDEMANVLEEQYEVCAKSKSTACNLKVNYEDFENKIDKICTKQVGQILLRDTYVVKCVRDAKDGTQLKEETIFENEKMCVGRSCDLNALLAIYCQCKIIWKISCLPELQSTILEALTFCFIHLSNNKGLRHI